MNYKVVENILSNIYQFAFDNKIIVAVLWIAVMFFLLRKLSKRDNEFYLKDFFKKNNLNYFLGTVIKEIKIKKIKLIIPQKTEPKKIKDRVSIILSLVILLKKNGFCKI